MGGAQDCRTNKMNIAVYQEDRSLSNCHRCTVLQPAQIAAAKADSSEVPPSPPPTSLALQNKDAAPPPSAAEVKVIGWKCHVSYSARTSNVMDQASGKELRKVYGRVAY